MEWNVAPLSLLPPNALRGYRIVWQTRGITPLALAMIAAALIFYIPVNTIFLRSRGLSYLEILSLESAMLVIATVCEVPSGLLADAIGKRWVIVAGFALNALTQIVFAVAWSYELFILSSVFEGASIAFLSGTREAVVYETLGGRAERLAPGVFGHLSALGLVAGVVAAPVGSWLANVDIGIPAVVTAVVSVIGAGLSFALPRPPRGPKVSSRRKGTSKAGLIRAIREVVRDPVLVYVAATPTFALFNSVYFLNQPVFRNVHIPVTLFGVIVSGAALLSAFVNHNVDILERLIGLRWLQHLALIVGGIGFAMLAIPLTVTAVVGFALVVCAMNARLPTINSITNARISTEYRATALSIVGLGGSGVGVLINPIIGFLLDESVTRTVLTLAAVLGLLGFIWIPISKGRVSSTPRR